MTDARLIDLEIRLTHQEATLQALNDVIAESIAAPWEEPPPPHY